MWDRIRIGRSQAGRSGDGPAPVGAPVGPTTAGRDPGGPPAPDRLAGGDLEPQPSPPSRGIPIPLDGSGTTDNQTFTVTSSNPDIAANIVSGPIWTVDVNYTDPTNSANDFSGPLVFQLFNSAGQHHADAQHRLAHRGLHQRRLLYEHR